MPSRARSGCCSTRPSTLRRAGIGIHAEQQIGRGKMEEAQGMGLHELAAMQEFAQHGRGFRNLHGHDGVAGLYGGEQMADRADAADARGDGRHLVEGPAFGEFLKSADLGDVDLGIRDRPSSFSWMVILAWPSMRVTGSILSVFIGDALPIRISPFRRDRAPGLRAVRRGQTAMALAGGGQPGTCRSTLMASCSGTACFSSAARRRWGGMP